MMKGLKKSLPAGRAAIPDSYRGSHNGNAETFETKKRPLHCCKGLQKKGGDILSHGMQYHLR